MSLVRLPQVVSISPEGHHHHQASLRRAELKAKPIFNHPVLVVGCLVWVHFSYADMLRHLRYTTSSRNGYAPLPNSHFLRYHPRNHLYGRCGLYRWRHLSRHHDAFRHHQYRMPMLPAIGQIGLRCHQTTAYKLQTPSGITNLETLRVLSSTLRRKVRARATVRRSLRILCLVAVAGSCGLNDDGCSYSLRIESSHMVHSVDDVFCLSSTYSDTSPDAVHRRPYGTVTLNVGGHIVFVLFCNFHEYTTIR